MANSRTRRRGTRRRIVATGLLVFAGTGVGVGLSATSASGTTDYRTAIVRSSSVSATLGASGTVQPVNQADADFQVSGAVASVDVTKGQRVTAGQTIATIATTGHEADLSQAQFTLASASAKLTEDEADESSSSSSSSPSSTGSSSAVQAGAPAASTTAASTDTATIVLTAATGTNGSGPGGGSGSGSLSQDQAAIVTDQHAVDTDMEIAAADLTTMQQACSSASSPQETTTTTPTRATPTTSTTSPTTSTTSPTTSTTSPTTSTTSPTTSGSTSTSTGESTGEGASAACAGDLTTASGAEQRVATDERTLATAETALADLLSAEAKATAPTTGASTTPSQSTSSQSSAGQSGGSRSGSSPSSTSSSAGGRSTPSSSGSASAAATSTDTPQQLASDEATIDSDQAAVVNAQQSLAAATLTAPISGTVESVGLASGDRVTAGSTTQDVTIVNWNSYEVTATLTTTQVQEVKVGQDAQINVDGTTAALGARVTRVGPAEGSGTSYTYPVVATITSPTGQLASGSAAQMTIDLSEANGVLVVPTSAVHTTATNSSYVELDRGGKEVQQKVRTGLVGTVYTQITSGLTSGQAVVLADPSQPVPSSSTKSATTNARTVVGPGGGRPTGFGPTGS